ncbi:DUF3231 family protein [Aquibacillus kalidii]|uniref:DUF3231 family protein n=1 Tax=Aquibacillus kalidii TaxID=2762597 RepID=UPI0016455613|nr:DUF3231 family protein [Aquibacillus kalidii]
MEEKVRLTSSEISVMWSSYQNNSFSICTLNHFLANVDDPNIRSVLQYSYEISEENLQKTRKILMKDNQPIPIGFTKDDVNQSAPRLYSDAFYLYYLKNMAKVGISVYGIALTTTARSDVRSMLSEAIKTSTELYNRTTDVLVEKGLFIRSPFVTTPDHVDFIEKKDYLGSPFNLINNNRPLNVVEITHIEANIEANIVGKVLLSGLSHVAKTKQVSQYCNRGKEIANKHVNVFTDMLANDELPTPMPWDIEVTDSTTSPFSDKLIMFHTTLMIASSISNYATSAAASLRTDISASYIRLSGETALYSKDGINIMIKNHWLEQPPQIPDHKRLGKN